MFRIVMLGPPASGKGTQAQFLAKKFKLPQITPGEIFRHKAKNKTQEGKLIAGYINKGRLVPNRITNELIKKTLKKIGLRKGYILDGYPRNLNQAYALEKISSPDFVFYLSLPVKEIIKRLSGRRTCPKCGKVYHLIFNPPRKDELCDKCKFKLQKRKDDTPSLIRERIRVYKKSTKPLIDFYRKKNKLIVIDGKPPIPQVSASILQFLKKQ